MKSFIQFITEMPYHGSPHKFEKFSTMHLGTGEGAQVYGWGIYIADNVDVAKSYQEMDRTLTINGKPLKPRSKFGKENLTEIYDLINVEYDHCKGDLKQIISRLFGYAASMGGIYTEAYNLVRDAKTIDKKGYLYHVELKPSEDEYLLWDETFFNQSKFVKQKLTEFLPKSFLKTNPTGDEIYNEVGDIDEVKMVENDELPSGFIWVTKKAPLNSGETVDKYYRSFMPKLREAYKKASREEQVTMKAINDGFLQVIEQLKNKKYAEASPEFLEMFHKATGVAFNPPRTSTTTMYNIQFNGDYIAQWDTDKDKIIYSIDWDAVREEISKEDISKFLLYHGIRGVKYLDGASRKHGEGSYNYVIFDEDDIHIISVEQ